MKKVFYYCFILFTTFPSTAQTPLNNYQELWEKVYTYELNILPKSANNSVEKIYIKAKEEKNTPQIIKALLYKSKFTLTLEEDAPLKIIHQLQTEIDKATVPSKNILENILAKLYWDYFQKNRWKFYKRTQTATIINPADFRTWDSKTIFAEIHKHYNNSLENETTTQQIPLEKYNALLTLVHNSQTYRPTLFDFLSHNALGFFKTSEHTIDQTNYKFEINNLNYITNFEKENFVHKDSSSLELNALKTYQKLVLFHKKDKNPTAYITVTLDAISFISQNCVLKDKEEILLNTYKQLKDRYRHHAVSTQIEYQIAKIYKEQANTYSPNQDKTHRFKNKKALAICELAQQLFPESNGAENCRVLKEQILNPSLRITTEKHIPSNLPSRLQVEYKNTDQLFFSIYKISHKKISAFYKINNDSARIVYLKNLKAIQKWNSKLRNEDDFQKHTTEINVPKLSLGSYLIFSTVQNDSITNAKTSAYATIQVTDLAIIDGREETKYNYQVVRRNTGKPIENATVNLKNDRSDRYSKSIDKNFTTDKNGQFSYENSQRHQNVIVTISTANEIAKFGDYYLYTNNYRNNSFKNEKTIIKPFIFTDRSIYRPGQKVSFKAIFIKKLENTSEVFTNELVQVIFKDSNGEKVTSLELKLNEYGAISGEFQIPDNGLTGNYTFEFKALDSEFQKRKNYRFDYVANASISVEEYKRPKFNTAFTDVKEIFRLNDTVTVIGNATAFSGSAISEANVSYRVVRTANFPVWHRRYYNSFNSSESIEVIHGETITDSKGVYKIKFKAIPDLKTPKESQPTFNYKVYADVTDINGETHSTETNVKVGYHALEVSISIANAIDRCLKTHTIDIDSKNLNNQFVATKGILKIYKLQGPKKPVRKRPWAAPDYQDISEESFEALYPNDPYISNDVKDWKKGTLVFEKRFDTEKSKTIKLKNIKKWTSGKYIAILEAKDKFKQLVKEENNFNVFAPNDKTVADNTIVFIKADKKSYKPYENMTLQIGSASEDITITIDIEKEHKIVSSHFIHLNNEIKTIKIPVTEKDRGGFAVKWHAVNFNAFSKGSLTISVPYKEKNLTVETVTFRDKLEPGAQQKWAFKIKGDKKESIAAEVLASMYDASLDAFKPHTWKFNPIQHAYYSTYGTYNRAYNSFGTKSFTLKNETYATNYFKNQSYDQLNWFGFTMHNSRYVNERYLDNLFAQRTKFEGTLSGIVTDKEDQPLPGVTIRIKNSPFGTTTDFDGKYSLKIKKNDIVVFSYIGFKSYKEKIKSSSKRNIQLEVDNDALDEGIVVGYGSARKKNATGAISSLMPSDMEEEVEETVLESTEMDAAISIRGTSSLSENSNALKIVDGVPFEGKINPEDIASIEVLKDAAATALYGSKGVNGVILIITKAGLKKLEAELNQVQARTNFKETAFFFPHLRTDEEGNISFEFTMPEALTKWKMQLLAHTKDARSVTNKQITITQKKLMVTPNAPRFLREGDQITISSKIASLSEQTLSGFAQLHLSDALTGKDINLLLDNTIKNQNFSISPKGNTQISWTIQIPENIQAVQYKVVAKAGDFSDGEQNVLPVLSNRMLVTETMPIWVNSNETKTSTLDKLKNKSSPTLKNHKLTLEMTSNPAWYALQALPYLMEYPYECAEQTFSRYYANALGNHVVNSNPNIKTVFEKWKSNDALLSNLEKNQELKSIIIQETPWLRDALSETQQKKRIALLFDLQKTKNQLAKTIDKLDQMQLKNGGFPWFKGNNYANRNITQHITAGFGHLNTLGVQNTSKTEEKIIKKALQFLDTEIENDYARLLVRAAKIKDKAKTKKKGIEDEKKFLARKHLNSRQLHYLYTRSFYKTMPVSKNSLAAVSYYKKQTAKYWKTNTLYNKGLTALILHRENKTTLSKKIVASLKENSINSEELGMYWKENKSSWYWYQSPIETQSLLIEVFAEIENNIQTIENLKKWLLTNKQTNRWKTTKATTEAVYALLLQGSNWLSIEDNLEITHGGQKLDPQTMANTKVEAGTGYFKTSWSADEITPEMATITISKKDKGMAWGGLYWQYFEELDKITSSNTSLKIDKKLFLKTNSDLGKVLTEITKTTSLKVGDLMTVRIEIASDRDMEFIHMKDMRASGVEPIDIISKYKYQDGLGYYQSTKDASTNFFFDTLRKGVYVFEYDVRINNAGNFSNGITTIQSMYAPEFSSHSKGLKIKVE
tara:strand:+ start:3555 stop:10151 length:6597 start_codon:yes stop_codon:yes gene_type:complete